MQVPAEIERGKFMRRALQATKMVINRKDQARRIHQSQLIYTSKISYQTGTCPVSIHKRNYRYLHFIKVYQQHQLLVRPTIP